METKSHTRARKAERQLKIFITSSQQLKHEHVQLIEQCSQGEVTKSLGDADIILNIKANMFFFSGLSRAINFQIPSLPFNANNLSSSFSLLKNYLGPSTFDRVKKKKEILKEFQKATQLEKKINSALTRNNDSEFAELSNRREELDSIYERTTSIEQFSQAILSLPSFKSYHSCQLLIHERGKQLVESYAYSRSGERLHLQVNIGKFNSIHNMVKKSKNRLFQAESLDEETLFVGTFLARDFTLEGHTIIFMVSRNDFLPPSSAEQHFFFDFCNLLTPLFSQLMQIEQLENKNTYLMAALDNINRALAVYDKDEKIIYANHTFRQNIKDHAHSLHKHYIPYSLSGRNKLYVHKYDMSEVTSQLFHFQRISLLGELLNTLQHELSNPLFGIGLSGQLLAQECEEPDSKEVLEEISECARRSQTIIENFSYLYKDENRLTEVNLNKLISETVILTKSETRNISKILQLPDEVITIKTNPTWITQIIFNLIINSSQAIKEYWGDRLAGQQIIIGAKRKSKSIELWVEDTGPGIDNAIADRIFTPFVTTKDQGTGLGLSICKNLANKLKAQIYFENKLNAKGARFTLELPLDSL